MADEPDDQDFRMTIADVLALPGRRAAVIGPVGSGVLHDGDEIDVWDGQHLVTSGRARLELVCTREAEPGSISLLLSGVATNLLSPGQTVRGPASTR